MSFQQELEQLINKYSQENGSNTPDFILARYLNGCLGAFNDAVNARELWYGRKPKVLGGTFDSTAQVDPAERTVYHLEDDASNAGLEEIADSVRSRALEQRSASFNVANPDIPDV